MSIRVTCPNGHKHKVKERYAGKRRLCPDCNAPIQIPKLVDKDSPTAITKDAPQVDEDAPTNIIEDVPKRVDPPADAPKRVDPPADAPKRVDPPADVPKPTGASKKDVSEPTGKTPAKEDASKPTGKTPSKKDASKPTGKKAPTGKKGKKRFDEDSIMDILMD